MMPIWICGLMIKAELYLVGTLSRKTCSYYLKTVKPYGVIKIRINSNQALKNEGIQWSGRMMHREKGDFCFHVYNFGWLSWWDNIKLLVVSRTYFFSCKII
jgi:hypothetical protein